MFFPVSRHAAIGLLVAAPFTALAQTGGKLNVIASFTILADFARAIGGP